MSRQGGQTSRGVSPAFDISTSSGGLLIEIDLQGSTTRAYPWYLLFDDFQATFKECIPVFYEEVDKYTRSKVEDAFEDWKGVVVGLCDLWSVAEHSQNKRRGGEEREV